MRLFTSFLVTAAMLLSPRRPMKKRLLPPSSGRSTELPRMMAP